MSEGLFVSKEVKIAASPEVVFPYLIDPEKLVRWNTTEATFDAHPGGSYRFTIGGSHVASGTVVEIDPPRRLVYTWGWEGSVGVPPGSTTVELELEDHGDHTIVRLTHRDLPNADARTEHAKGWEHYLGRLAVVAAGGDAGPDPWAAGAAT